ncbi:hypothetical protein B834_815 [Enterococcus mundtii 1A]|nr:hypothetical protein [Enterococcus mundtii 1A]
MRCGFYEGRNNDGAPKLMAERLGVSVQTLQCWANDDMLKAHRTPKNRR